MARKRDRDIRHAAEIRTDARRQHDRIGAKDAEARRIEAEAEEARAEAERLEAIARDRRAAVDHDRRTYAERMREADRLDHGRTGTHAQR
jgi:hypothetical protein